MNPYGKVARLKKAHKLADFLDAKFVDMSEEYRKALSEMGDAWWTALALEVGVNPPSQETVELVLGILEDRSDVSDPFEGLGNRKGQHDR